MKLQHSPLAELCRTAGVKMSPFEGWEMPLQFSGLIKEHNAVRKKAGVFDISHMGVLLLEGENPKAGLQKLVRSDLHRLGPGEACYTLLLNEQGGVLDDLIVYDLGSPNKSTESLILIVNAATFDHDQNWLKQHLAPAGINIKDAKGDDVLLALQGPDYLQTLEKISLDSRQLLPGRQVRTS